MTSTKAWRWLGALALLTACGRDAPPPSARAAVPAAAPGPLPAGVELLEARVARAAGEPARVHGVRADLAQVALRVVVSPAPRDQWLTAESAAAQSGAIAALNGGFFDDHSRPLGLLVADGRQVGRLRRADWGVFYVRGGRAHLVHTRDARGLTGVEQAVQCGPRLVIAGAPTRLKPSDPAPRSAVGIDAAGRVLFVAVQGGGLPLSAFAKVLARPVDAGGFGCRDALNLDGGPSTQFCVPGRVSLVGAYGMPTHLVLVPRDSVTRR